MVFTSISFIYYFLPILLLLYFISPKKLKNIILLLFSILFYFYGEPKYIILMIIEVIISYIGGIIIEKNQTKQTLLLFTSIHIILLCIFKYLDFFILNVNNLLDINIKLTNLILPIGISFYTFQIISYEIDIYKKEIKPQKNILKYTLYVFLFPQLIAGPIVRYKDINKEIENRTSTPEKISQGIKRFIIGLSKKVIIANNLGELCNILQGNTTSTLSYWICAISYMLQIYFDFSGYSDIAIGLGKIFGFTFLENFNYPFISKSITEFWRRWHISLSTWFRDYIYIPLGGNKKGIKKQIRNILIVWTLTGLWHGASYNFIIWGLYFGILLILEKFILNKIINKTPTIFRHLITLFLIMISFIIFNFENPNIIITQIKGLFQTTNPYDIYTIYYLKGYLIYIILGIISSTPLPKKIYQNLKQSKISSIINITEPIILILLLILVTIYLIDSTYNPFLYFRF